jgi:pyrroline-5-carboxylate reductase
MKHTFGFIGCGNMGGALARAVCRGADPQSVTLANRTRQKAEALAAELSCRVADNETVAASCEYIFLGVKPQMMEEMLSAIAPALRTRTTPFVLVSMAAGLSMARIRAMAGGEYPIIRIMPNTPCMVGEGMTQYCTVGVSEDALSDFLAAMASAGRFDAVEERLMDAAGCVSGCGPAFAYLFIEALADGGVACGLPRAQAVEYAAQMMAGAARMVLESGEHPGLLKDRVCSPGGTTIQGVRALEANGFRSACMEAVIAAYDKTLAMK